MRCLGAYQKGHEFAPVRFELSPGWVGAYVRAVGDTAVRSLGPDAVPPMAVAALSIRALLEQAGLPEGAVHVGQELGFHRTVRVGESLAASARIISRGERQGWALMGVDLSVLDQEGAPVMTGRAMVTFPLRAGTEG